MTPDVELTPTAKVVFRLFTEDAMVTPAGRHVMAAWLESILAPGPLPTLPALITELLTPPDGTTYLTEDGRNLVGPEHHRHRR